MQKQWNNFIKEASEKFSCALYGNYTDRVEIYDQTRGLHGLLFESDLSRVKSLSDFKFSHNITKVNEQWGDFPEHIQAFAVYLLPDSPKYESIEEYKKNGVSYLIKLVKTEYK